MYAWFSIAPGPVLDTQTSILAYQLNVIYALDSRLDRPAHLLHLLSLPTVLAGEPFRYGVTALEGASRPLLALVTLLETADGLTGAEVLTDWGFTVCDCSAHMNVSDL